jgi:2-polyprenyl-3-methyl-5-hydroxy-6-metoxy-1,4-benzoquinol methylase
MDRNDIPFADMAITLKELNIVNTRLGGHALTCGGVESLMKSANGEISVCEIGCGGGDNLAAIFKKFAKSGKTIRFTGIDINPECIKFASQKYPELKCNWVCNDYANVNFTEHEKPDIIFSSLFCHHFTDEQLVSMLNWQYKNSKLGFFINDLHRHWLAYYLIKYITKIFSRSYLVKNDAAISVSRGFRKNEWISFFKAAGISNYSIKWKWAFRYLVICKK